MSDKIDIKSFRKWEKDEVTVALFKALKRVREDVVFEMQDANLIMANNAEKKLARLVGIREGLDLVLEITFEELEDEDEREDEEKED